MNKVQIDGNIARSMWGSGENSGFFVTIKQERKINKFSWVNYFSIYANKPLADELAKIVEKNPNAYIAVEGQLRTYHSKKDNSWKTTIHVEKILKHDETTSSIEQQASVVQ